jgi:hypothetical protein
MLVYVLLWLLIPEGDDGPDASSPTQ